CDASCTDAPRLRRKSWFREQVSIPGIDIDGERNVFLDDKPFATDLAKDVGHPDDKLLAGSVLLSEVSGFDVVSIRDRTNYGDAEIRHCILDGSWECGEERFPVLFVAIPARVL